MNDITPREISSNERYITAAKYFVLYAKGLIAHNFPRATCNDIIRVNPLSVNVELTRRIVLHRLLCFPFFFFFLLYLNVATARRNSSIIRSMFFRRWIPRLCWNFNEPGMSVKFTKNYHSIFSRRVLQWHDPGKQCESRETKQEY